jgi:hypothetical protein
LFFNNVVPSDSHGDIHYMNSRIGNLGLHHIWLLCSFHFFVLKHILHVTILRIVYNLMSSFNIDMTRIPHRSLYSYLLSGNLRNCRNKLFFSFDSTCFDIMICPMTICIVHSYFLCNCLRNLN